MTVHIMLDLETWGTTPGSDVRSIGACVFDPLSGDVAEISGLTNIGDTIKFVETRNGDVPIKVFLPKCFYVACDNPEVSHYETFGKSHAFKDGETYRLYPLTRDPKTVQWWSEQSDEARAAFANPVDLRDALDRFTAWLNGLWDEPGTPDLRLWSHGPSFDVSILSAAYRAVGLPEPWHYRAPRDTRTAFDMAGVDDHSAWLGQYSTGTHHHALDDAICQARAVCSAWGRVADWRTTHEAVFIDKGCGGGD